MRKAEARAKKNGRQVVLPDPAAANRRVQQPLASVNEAARLVRNTGR